MGPANERYDVTGHETGSADANQPIDCAYMYSTVSLNKNAAGCASPAAAVSGNPAGDRHGLPQAELAGEIFCDSEGISGVHRLSSVLDVFRCEGSSACRPSSLRLHKQPTVLMTSFVT